MVQVSVRMWQPQPLAQCCLAALPWAGRETCFGEMSHWAAADVGGDRAAGPTLSVVSLLLMCVLTRRAKEKASEQGSWGLSGDTFTLVSADLQAGLSSTF